MEKWEDINILNENVLESHATFHYEKTVLVNLLCMVISCSYHSYGFCL